MRLVLNILFITIILFHLHCNGIGGTEVITKGNFEGTAESFFLIREVDCENQYPTNNSQQSSASENNPNHSSSIGLHAGSFFEFGNGSVDYVTIKDAKYCYLTLFTTPCGNIFSYLIF